MSRLRELIDELCPDGVEYKALSELFDIRNGYTPSKKNPAFWDGGTHPWFVMEDIRRDGTVLHDSSAHITDEAVKKGLFPANSIIVATSATIGVHALVTVDFLCNQRFACMTVKGKYADMLDVRYAHQAFFALDRWCLEHVDQGSFATVNGAALKAYRIPVPPIEVQREIVRILDSFQKLDDALTAEIEAREKQFQGVLDFYLYDAFSEDPMQELGVLATVTDGSHKSPPGVTAGHPMPSVKDMRTRGFDFSDCKQVGDKDYEELCASGCRPKMGDVLIAKDGALLLKHAFAVHETPEYVVLSSIAILRPDTNVIDSDYLAYCFNCERFKDDVARKYSSVSGVPRIILKNFKRMLISVPPMDEQKNMVVTLDALRDLIDALVFERDARRKQFEHYRDKLLSFPEREA